jgi:hypothetical protein
MQETKAGGWQIQGQPELQSEFKADLSYIVEPCLKNPRIGDVAQLVECLSTMAQVKLQLDP